MVLAAAALLSGCVSLQTERVPGYISFEPLVGHDTRAVESVPFPEDLSFKVWAVNQTTGGAFPMTVEDIEAILRIADR